MKAEPAVQRQLLELAKVDASHGLTVSAFYTSNVEFYLFREGSFARFVDNVSRLPHADRALIDLLLST